MTSLSPREPAEQLRITLFEGDGDPDTWIELCGEADLFTASDLETRLFKALEERGERHSVCIDLRRLTFSDLLSTVALVAFADTVSVDGCEVWFFGPQQIVLRLLDFLDQTDRIHRV